MNGPELQALLKEKNVKPEVLAYELGVDRATIFRLLAQDKAFKNIYSLALAAWANGLKPL